MMDANSDTDIDADDTAYVYFTVDVNSAWWQANSLPPETYTVDLTVAATNDDDEVRLEDVTIPAVVNIDGFGPELFASIISRSTITPGDNFTLSITIENFGDDIAREVDAYLRADFVAGWSIVDQFVTAISPYEGMNWGGGGDIGDASWGWADDWESYDYFNRSRNKDIMPGDLDVGNVVELVQLHDWIQRRETQPQGVILWMHVDRLAPGDTHVFMFDMVSDKNMVPGMVYYETLELYFVDSNGEDYGPNGKPVGNVEEHYAPPQEVLIRAGKGDKFEGQEDEFDPAVLLYAVIFVIIVFILFLIGYALGKGGKGTERREAPYMPPEEEYGPPADEELPPPEEKPPV
jgi:hypothetical protein